jgi:hypothetical protein
MFAEDDHWKPFKHDPNNLLALSITLHRGFFDPLGLDRSPHLLVSMDPAPPGPSPSYADRTRVWVRLDFDETVPSQDTLLVQGVHIKEARWDITGGLWGLRATTWLDVLKPAKFVKCIVWKAKDFFRRRGLKWTVTGMEALPSSACVSCLQFGQFLFL